MNLVAKLRQFLSKPSVLKNTEAQKKVDLLQQVFKSLPQVDCPLEHTFTPGLYGRACTFPAGAMIISKIHKTEHQFVILKGKVRVWSEDTGTVTLEAPHHGITTPGTRRVFYALEETIWMTFHATKEKTPEDVENKIIEPRELPPLNLGEIKECLLLPQL